MPHPGQEIHGFGVVLRLVRIEPDVLEIEASYDGSAGLPPGHLHPGQEERFEVLDGRMRAVMGDEERVYERGERFDVPAATPHEMAAEGPARVRWEVRPALRTAEFFERLCGEGAMSARESESLASFLAEFEDEIRFG